MTDFLLHFLPTALATAIQLALLVLGTSLVLALLVRRFSSRKALFVRTWGNPAGEFAVDGKAISEGIRKGLHRIWMAHAPKGLYSEGEVTNLGDPRRESEDLGSKAVSLLAGNSPVGFLVDISSRIWPVLELEGEVVIGDNRTLRCFARLKRGRKYFHAWQAEVPKGKDAEARLAEELAYRIALDTARLGVLDDSRSAGTRSWEAFRALTQAMEIWSSPEFSLTDPASVAKVDAKLAEAIRHDPGYSLAHFDRGILQVTRLKDAETNARAREHFREARKLAMEQARAASRRKVTVDRRVEGLAALGIARSLSQDRHRYGRTGEDLVGEAREAASEAVQFLNRSPHALYALAFAWHCTDALDDIREGRKLYEEIIEREPRRHPGVHNNLGYILMVGGERLRDLGREEEAQEWWKEAEREMLTTLEISDPRRRTLELSRANLGNLYRLQGRYQEAEAQYLEALGPDPETSSYTNGLNELARLYLEMGRTDEGTKFHRLALASTDDEGHRAKLAAELGGPEPSPHP